MILGRGTFPAGWIPSVPSGNGNCQPLLEELLGDVLYGRRNILLKLMFLYSFRIVNLPIMNPIVTSSGKRILSPMLVNFPSPAIGNIRRVNALLKQNPAPPVANQKVIFFEGVSVGIFCFVGERFCCYSQGVSGIFFSIWNKSKNAKYSHYPEEFLEDWLCLACRDTNLVMDYIPPRASPNVEC